MLRWGDFCAALRHSTNHFGGNVTVQNLFNFSEKVSEIQRSIALFSKRQFKYLLALAVLFVPALAHAAEPAGEANLTLPDLSSVSFLGINGHSLLEIGLLFCAAGLLFGLVIYVQLKNLPVHKSMLEVSDIIYETCKTYLITQGKFIMLLWVFIAVVISLYFGWLAPVPGKPIAVTLPIILLF